MRNLLQAPSFQQTKRNCRTRALRLESLEGRRMFAVVMDGIDPGVLSTPATESPQVEQPAPADPGIVDDANSAPWQNPLIHEDVDNSGFVSLNDLLDLVQDLRDNGIGHGFPASSQGTDTPPPYLDVNGDNIAAIDDLLQVVTALREGLGAPTPEIVASLLTDTGEQDGVTSDPTIVGQVVDGLTEETTVVGQIDSGALFLLELDAQGNFAFDPRTIAGGLTEGEHAIRFFAQNRGFNVDSVEIVFTFTNESSGGDAESVDAVFEDESSMSENASDLDDPLHEAAHEDATDEYFASIAVS